MSKKLKIAAGAYLAVTALSAQPSAAVLNGCMGEPAYCDSDVVPEGSFWGWEAEGYTCQEIGGVYHWVLDWYQSGGGLSQSAAQNEASESEQACNEFHDL